MIRLIPRLVALVEARYGSVESRRPGIGNFYAAVGLSASEWHRLKRGQRPPSLKQLQRIGRTFPTEFPELWILEEDGHIDA